MREKTLLHIGAACALLGALAAFAGSIAHPVLPSTVDETLQLVAGVEAWRGVHLTIMVGVVLFLGAFLALGHDLPLGVAWALARLGSGAATFGAALAVVNLAIDGFGLKLMADAWAAAPPAQKPELLRVGQAVLAVQTGLFYAWVAAFLGLPFLLFGLALTRSRHYPAWSGWLGIFGGALMLAYGVVQLHGEIAGVGPLFYRAAVIPIAWMLLMGVLMWRRANAAPEPRIVEAAETPGDEHGSPSGSGAGRPGGRHVRRRDHRAPPADAPHRSSASRSSASSAGRTTSTEHGA